MTDTTDIAPELLNDERALRLKRREEFMAEGTNPYPEHSEVRDYAADIEGESTPTWPTAKTPRTS